MKHKLWAYHRGDSPTSRDKRHQETNPPALDSCGYQCPDWFRDAKFGITVPTRPVSPYTCALQITGTDLQPVPVPVETITVSPDAQGNATCAAADAELHGDQIQMENQGGQPNVGFWDRADEWVSWKIKFDQPGSFLISASCATVHANAEFVVELADQQLTGKPVQTGGWADFKILELGRIRIEQPGLKELKVRTRSAQTWRAINLRWGKLVRTLSL